MSKPTFKFQPLPADKQRALFAEWQTDRLWTEYLASKWYTPYLH